MIEMASRIYAISVIERCSTQIPNSPIPLCTGVKDRRSPKTLGVLAPPAPASGGATRPRPLSSGMHSGRACDSAVDTKRRARLECARFSTSMRLASKRERYTSAAAASGEIRFGSATMEIERPSSRNTISGCAISIICCARSTSCAAEISSASVRRHHVTATCCWGSRTRRGQSASHGGVHQRDRRSPIARSPRHWTR
jgi:hypothetical protein